MKKKIIFDQRGSGETKLTKIRNIEAKERKK